VAVDEEEPVSSGTPERQHAANDDTAIAAEYQREFTLPQHSSNCLGEAQGIILDPIWIED
jgi:hypothetical protein